MLKPSIVLILGSIRRGEYETITAHGFRMGIILDENRKANLPATDPFDIVLHHDFSLPLSKLDPLIEQICNQFTVTTVLNLREFYVRALTYTTQALSLPGLPNEAVDFVLNKTLMRKTFTQTLGTSATPQFREVATLDECLTFIEETGYPIVLKPNNLYGSLFVSVVNDAVELSREFTKIQLNVSAHIKQMGITPSLKNMGLS